jgi:hypothetical protein
MTTLHQRFAGEPETGFAELQAGSALDGGASAKPTSGRGIVSGVPVNREESWENGVPGTLGKCFLE